MPESIKETIEEASKRYATEMYGIGYHPDVEKAFKKGAEGQKIQSNKEISIWRLAVEKQEARCKALKALVTDALQKSYDKEEVLEQLNLLYSMKNSTVDTFTDDEDRITEKWFEQFK